MATTATVGLTATLDITDFQKNAAAYMRTLQQMQQAAQQTQSSTASSFSRMGNLGSGVVPALNSIATGFGAVGAAATAAAVGGIAYVSASSLQMASNFEQGLADIAARMRETTSSITPLRDELMRLAISPDLKVSMDDVTTAAGQLASAGITMEQQLGGALQKTIEFQNAVGGDFGTAANVAIGAMGVFNVSSNNMSAAVDGATGAINRSKLTLNDYDYAISNAGTAFAGFGGSLAEFNTVLATTAWAFKTGRVQGTGISMMMNSMAVPTDKAKSAMLKLGLTFWDNQGKAKKLYDIVDELRAKLSNLSKEEQRTALSDIFGRGGGGTAMMALIQKTGAELQAFEKEVNATGQAANAAETRMFTLQSQFGAFQDIVGTASISIASMFVPILRDGLISINTALNPLVKSFDSFGLSGVAAFMGLSKETIGFSENVDQKFKSISETLSKGGIIAAINEMGISTQNLAIGFNALVGAAEGLLVLGAIAAGFTAVAFAMTPVGMATIGLTTAFAALGAAWQTNFMGIQNTTAKLATIIYQLAAIIKVGLNTASQEFTIYYDSVSSKTKSFYEWYLSSGVTLWGNINKVIDYAMSFFSKRVQDGMKQASEFVDYYAKYILSSINSVIDSMNSIGANLPPVQVANAVAPVFDQPTFSSSMGTDFLASLTSFTSLFETSNQVIPPYISYIEQAKNGTLAFGQSATDSSLAFADYDTNVLQSAESNKKLGQSAEQAAKQIENAKEKINDNGVSMAKLRGEIQGLEAAYPGLTNEVINNFNAHVAAGGSVASFGDKLGATERRQMFEYLAKLNDMDAANQKLIASNGIVASSVIGTGDSFRDQYLTMATGLTPVVTATEALTTSLTTATTTALPALATSLTDTVTPAISSTGAAADTLANTQFNGLQSQISTMLNPSLGQLNTQLAEQVSPALSQTGIKADEMKEAFQRAIDKNKLFFESNNLVIVSLKNERKAVEDLIKYYDELYKAKLRAANTSGATPAPSTAPSGAPAPSQTFPQFAKGGSFVVPSGYPTNSAGMGIGVHSGELVKVFTAQQTRQMKRLQSNNHIVTSSNTSNDNSRVVNFNITTQQPSKSVLRDLAFAKAKYGVI